MQSIRVNLNRLCNDSYDIWVGEHALDRLNDLPNIIAGADRYIIVSDTHVNPLYGETVKRKLVASGLPVDIIEIPAGEASKTMATVLDVTGRLMALEASRISVLVALGGGVVGDLTGFVASIFKRSIPFVQVATSLVAQVDSSVGGKTGVDLPEGKNLLGTFYQPKAVFIDPRCLDTLPQREFKNGLAEIIKYGIIRDKALFETLEREKEAIHRKDTALMQHLIMRSCRIKADIVEADEKEGGLRRILNFGHTVGHALEAASGYMLSHGEAVAVGTVIAAEISRRLGHLNDDSCRRIERVVKQYGLPTTVPRGCDVDTVIGFLASDKKAVGDKIHYVLVRDIGDPFVTADVLQDMVGNIIRALRK